MAKAPNYTPEMTKEIVAAYEAAEGYDARAEVIANMAEKFGKSLASVRQKLTREGVYQKKEYATKAGGKPESKAAIVSDIADSLGVTDEQAGSLEKANNASKPLKAKHDRRLRGVLGKFRFILDLSFLIQKSLCIIQAIDCD